MLPRGSGTILFTGASASVKGYAQSAPFAMGKFALRGLAQSMARELGPQGIHVAHVKAALPPRRGFAFLTLLKVSRPIVRIVANPRRNQRSDAQCCATLCVVLQYQNRGYASAAGLTAILCNILLT